MKCIFLHTCLHSTDVATREIIDLKHKYKEHLTMRQYFRLLPTTEDQDFR